MGQEWNWYSGERLVVRNTKAWVIVGLVESPLTPYSFRALETEGRYVLLARCGG
jgi:hypothetical protein